MKYSGGLKTERFWILDGPMWSVYSSNHSKTEQIRWPQFCSVKSIKHKSQIVKPIMDV